jgi:hypothetical protein
MGMIVLADQHQRPQRLVNTGTGTISSTALIKQGDVARMNKRNQQTLTAAICTAGMLACVLLVLLFSYI